MKNYKDTLLVGKTTFEMRAFLSEKEPKFLSFWDQQDIYKKNLELNKNNQPFVLHDGPPYANGSIHIGHALNKILKDMVVRWKTSLGYYSPFVLGWDTHGLPIENAIVKKGLDRKATPPDVFRQKCEEYALEQIQIQATDFKRLGVSTDFEDTYVTLTKEFVKSELLLFKELIKKKIIYKDLKPIYWSPSSESALAEAELEYKDVESNSIYVGFNVTKGNEVIATNDQLVIWTTTPWTIPSNQLIAVGKDINYVLVSSNLKTKIIVAKNTLDSLISLLNLTNVAVMKEFKGTDIVGIEYVHPLYDNKFGKVVLGHHVRDDGGTGLVHCATGFGMDDYIIGKANNVPIFAPIDNLGKFTSEVADPELEGLYYTKSEPIIIDRLEKKGLLLKVFPFKHSYPHDWRTKKPIMYRATQQWFINLDSSRDQIINQAKQVKTIPQNGHNRLITAIAERKEWTISRQRLWGVPIIAFYDENKQLQVNEDLIQHVIDIFDKTSVDEWFTKPADYFLPQEYQNKNWTKETDILDVWFDSGSSSINLERTHPGLNRPYDLYLEGNDQYRGWFNSSLINSVLYDGKSPYKNLVIAGMTNDENGIKMSKSLGNGVDPLEVINSLGADVLRLWVYSVNFVEDQRIGTEILKQVTESYRKIRNTLRFVVANLFDFDPQKDYQTNLSEVNQYALHIFSDLKKQVKINNENFSFNTNYSLINNYIISDLSAFYLDFTKDILYIEAADSLLRREVQTVLYEVLKGLMDMLKNVLVFSIEELYQELPYQKTAESVHLLRWVDQDFSKDLNFVARWNKVMKFRADLNFCLEQARNQNVIKKSFEASVEVVLTEEFEEIKTISNLAQVLIVNNIKFVDQLNQNVARTSGLFSISKKNGLKCERCWAIYDKLNENEICDRCERVIG